MSSQRINTSRASGHFFNICFGLNCLLIFLLLFESRLTIPPWLQVTGRMHPLLVHFPIVLVILYALVSIVPLPKRAPDDAPAYPLNDALLFLAALTSVLAALMGLFLSREEGYDQDALQLHKWGGVGLSVFTLAWYYMRKSIQRIRFMPYAVSAAAFAIILVTGHQGASITHGEDFLLAPVTPEKPKPRVPFDEALVFADMVKPIISEKCMSCHNTRKAKGELIMESEETLLKGGKSGKLWDSTARDFGLLLQRVHLPVEQKKHMPPHGKPQLTDEELAIIENWIRKGSDFGLKAADLPETDTLRMIAVRIFTSEETVQYDFEEADPAKVRTLNTANRVIAKEALNSPALTVSFFNKQLFHIDQLKELSRIKKQVVSIDLSKMPVKDADIKMITQFENLRRLHLNFTEITGAALAELQRLKFLTTLSISGTKVNAQQLEQVKNFPALKKVYAWNIEVDSVGLQRIQENAKNIHFETGFTGGKIALKLSPPLLQNEEQIVTGKVPLRLKHFLPGVAIRYTTDGTNPDSIKSRLYKGGDMIDGSTVIRAKAFKQGWISSDIEERTFLMGTHIPDTILLLTPTDSTYSGSGQLLKDRDKGTTNFREGNWLAWRKNRMEVLLEYKKPVTATSVTISGLLDINSFIMPPVSLEVWGGTDVNNLKILSTITPQPQDPLTKDSLRKHPSSLKFFECDFTPASIKYIKIIGKPVERLPKWHAAAGQRGYIFVDEIVVN